jgi:curved DNA-binding protein CbpA
MKRISEQNYYELLDVSPQASTQEIQWAYDQAMSIFSADSIPTYSLLSEKERKLILSRIVDAYKTLTNGHLRAEYNQLLLESGELLPEDLSLFSLENPDGINGDQREGKLESLLPGEETAESPMASPEDSFHLIDIDSALSGKDIQALRIAREISIEDIYRKTNVPKKTIEDIEEERFEELPALVYLKGFLKAYARILNVNEGQMMDGYVKRFLEWKTSFQR